MIKLKKFFIGIFISSLVLSLTACKSDDKKTSSEDEKLGDVKLGDYFGVEVKVDEAEVTQEEIDEVVKQYLKTHKTKDESATVVKDGDIVNIDYVGKKDGKEFDGGSAKDYSLEIGSKTFIDGFESALVGKKVGKTEPINLKFPKDYGEKSLAGADVVFDVTINYIYKVPDKLTDDIIKSDEKMKKYKSAKEYLDSLKKEIKDRKEKTNQEKLGELVTSKIMDNCEFSNLNKEYIRKNYEKRYDTIVNDAKSQGMDLDTFIKQSYGYTEKEAFEKDLIYIETDFTKKNIMLDEIAKKENISLSDEEYDKQMETWVNDAKSIKSDADKDYIIDAYGSEDAAKQEALRAKVMKELIGKAKITYVKPEKKDDASKDSKDSIKKNN